MTTVLLRASLIVVPTIVVFLLILAAIRRRRPVVMPKLPRENQFNTPPRQAWWEPWSERAMDLRAEWESRRDGGVR